MKKPLLFLAIIVVFASCTSKNKTDYNMDSADTSANKEQSQDQTRMNDTMPTMNRDTAQQHSDTIQH
jgi:hypothetical protein